MTTTPPLREYFDVIYWPARAGEVTYRHGKDCKLAINKLSEFLGRPSTVDDLNVESLAAFKQWAEQRIPSNCDKMVTMLRNVWRVAHLKGILPNEPPQMRRLKRRGGAVSKNKLPLSRYRKIAKNKSPRMLLRDFLDCIYTPRRMADSAKGSLEQYRVTINRFEAYLQREATLADLNEDTIYKWLGKQRQSGLAAATCNRRLTMVKTLWQYAKRRGFPLPEAGLDVIDKFREPKRLPEAWLEDEMERIIESAQLCRGRIDGVPANKYWVALILVLYDTGVRRKVAFAIRREEIDFKTGFLRVPAERMKNRCEQIFRLSPQVLQAIAASFPPVRRMVFPWPYVCQHGLYDRLRVILQRAGLPTTSRDLFHKFRRTTASQIAKVSGEAAAIMQLGHQDPSTIKRYIDPRFTNKHDGALTLPRPGLSPTDNLHRVNGVASCIPQTAAAPIPTSPIAAPLVSHSTEDRLNTLRRKSYLTWGDVRQILKWLKVPPATFAVELKTNGGWFKRQIVSDERLGANMEGRVRVALGLATPRWRKTKEERGRNYA